MATKIEVPIYTETESYSGRSAVVNSLAGEQISGNRIPLLWDNTYGIEGQAAIDIGLAYKKAENNEEASKAMAELAKNRNDLMFKSANDWKDLSTEEHITKFNDEYTNISNNILDNTNKAVRKQLEPKFMTQQAEDEARARFHARSNLVDNSIASADKNTTMYKNFMLSTRDDEEYIKYSAMIRGEYEKLVPLIGRDKAYDQMNKTLDHISIEKMSKFIDENPTAAYEALQKNENPSVFNDLPEDKKDDLRKYAKTRMIEEQHNIDREQTRAEKAEKKIHDEVMMNHTINIYDKKVSVADVDALAKKRFYKTDEEYRAMRNLAKIVAKGEDEIDTPEKLDTRETLNNYVAVKDTEGLRIAADQALKDGLISKKKHEFYTKQAMRADVSESSAKISRWFDASDLTSGISLPEKDAFINGGKKAKEYFEEQLNRNRDPRIVAQEAIDFYTSDKVKQSRARKFNEPTDKARVAEEQRKGLELKKNKIFDNLSKGLISEDDARKQYNAINEDYQKAISQ